MQTTEEILRSRAAALAGRKRIETATEEKVSVTVFVAGSERFGIPTASLSCIVKTPGTASLPHLPHWFRGVAQVRGDIIGVVDPAVWFGVPGRSTGALMAVVEGEPGRVGLLVDQVLGFRDVGPSDLAETFGQGAGAWERPIRGATRDLTAILDMDKLFASPDLRVRFGVEHADDAADLNDSFGLEKIK